MRILYTNFHRGPALNGHVTYVMSLARALAALHHIVVASPAGSWLLRQAEAEPGIVAVAQPFPNRIFEMFGAVRQLRRIIRRGFLDGRHGLVLAVAASAGSFFRYAKLMFLNARKP